MMPPRWRLRLCLSYDRIRVIITLQLVTVNRSSFYELVFMHKTVKIVLEIVKLIATALLGYFGGNALV